MKQSYKEHTIVVVVSSHGRKWRPSCRILDESSGKFLKELDGYASCATREEAETAGLAIAKKWIDDLNAKFR